MAAAEAHEFLPRKMCTWLPQVPPSQVYSVRKSASYFSVLAAFVLSSTRCSPDCEPLPTSIRRQMVAGRWIGSPLDPSVDVFSYTAADRRGLSRRCGNYLLCRLPARRDALISWIGAAACVGAVALLLHGSRAPVARWGSRKLQVAARSAVPITALGQPGADMSTGVLSRHSF